MLVSILDLRVALVLLVDVVTGETSPDPPPPPPRGGLDSLKDNGLVSSLRRSRKDLLLLIIAFMDTGFSREELVEFLWAMLGTSRGESLESSISVMIDAGSLQVGVLGWTVSFSIFLDRFFGFDFDLTDSEVGVVVIAVASEESSGNGEPF